MYTTYRANVNELDISFINALKTMFKNKDIEIAICEATESSEDETSAGRHKFPYHLGNHKG